MKLRRTLVGAALAVAATMGMTVPLATPALAGSCTDVTSVHGWNDAATYQMSGSFNMDWKTTARVSSNCSEVWYKYQQILYSGDTVYGQATRLGTSSYGSVSFDVLRTAYVPAGTSALTLGMRVYARNPNTFAWELASEDTWSVKAPNKSYDSSTETNATNTGCVRSYNQPCIPVLL